MKICYFPTLNEACSQMRCINPAEAIFKVFNQDSVKVHVDHLTNIRSTVSWESALIAENEVILQRLDAAFKFFDVLIFQRIQKKAAWSMLKEMADTYDTLIGVDLDDSVGFNTESNPHIGRFTNHHHDTVKVQMRESDFVIVSTEYLKKQVLAFNQNIHVMRNFLTWDEDIEMESNDGEKVRCLYPAAAGHDEEVDFLVDVFNSPVMDGFELVVRYGGYLPDSLKKINGDFKQSAYAVGDYPKHIAKTKCNIYLAPLIGDTVFNRCRSELKLLEGSFFDIPIVASKIPTYTNAKKPNHIIFSKNTLKDWRASIKNAMSGYEGGGLAWLQENYDPKKTASDLICFLKGQASTSQDDKPFIEQKYKFLGVNHE